MENQIEGGEIGFVVLGGWSGDARVWRARGASWRGLICGRFGVMCSRSYGMIRFGDGLVHGGRLSFGQGGYQVCERATINGGHGTQNWNEYNSTK